MASFYYFSASDQFREFKLLYKLDFTSDLFYIIIKFERGAYLTFFFLKKFQAVKSQKVLDEA